MFGQIPPTQYDLNFELFGIPVRVHPVFWVTSVFLAWSPGEMDKVVLRVACIFLSITVHELGHAIVTRHYGWRPEIVLYFFGGYATSMRHAAWKDIAVSAAGPIAGFALFGTTWLSAWILDQQGVIVSPLVADATLFLLWINLVWNGINLLPVEPLDGGQIARELFHYYDRRNGPINHIKLSMLVSGAVALWAGKCLMDKEPFLPIPISAFSWKMTSGLDPLFLTIMFGYLCYQNYQTYERMRGGRW